ncbi:MAG: sodium-dependent transporter [Bacteroidota bacterium]
MKNNTPVFSSRWSMMLAMLGMAVGTGNIWRFPRIAAKNGGGEFLIAWIVFLFLWSIPLILLEFGMGRKTRSGPIKSFVNLMGPKFAWMGAFVVFVASAIMFYYSVVAGWTVRYTVASLVGEIPGAVPGTFWTEFISSFVPVLTHALMIGLAIFVVAKGVKGIEKVTNILMPTLIGIILLLTIRALFLPGASEGLSYLFSVDWAELGNPTIWIEALTQNAWDTGAGWGLVLCYAIYLREKEDTALNAFILPTTNNILSLLAGIMIFSTVFSIMPGLVEQSQTNPELLQGLGSLKTEIENGADYSPELLKNTIFSAGNEGITFIWMPQLFKMMGFGQIFMFLFFLALAFAAFSSLVSLVEVATRAFVDMGMERKKVIRWIGLVGFLMGVPSALSMDFFANQDWVWAVALMVAGLFFTLSIRKYGIRKFREEQINHPDSQIKVGRWWDIVIGYIAPLEMILLMAWFFYGNISANPDSWYHIFSTDNTGTVLFQFALVIGVLLLLNKWMVKKIEEAEEQKHSS